MHDRARAWRCLRWPANGPAGFCCLLVLTATVLAACGQSDADAIRTRMNLYAQHLSAGDTTALVNDTQPGQRCTPQQMELGLEAIKRVSGGKIDARYQSIKIDWIRNNQAQVEAPLLINGSLFAGGQPGVTTQRLVKDQGEWYLVGGCGSANPTSVLAAVPVSL